MVKNDEEDPRVDDTQYDPPSAGPLATASENEQAPPDDAAAEWAGYPLTWGDEG